MPDAAPDKNALIPVNTHAQNEAKPQPGDKDAALRKHSSPRTQPPRDCPYPDEGMLTP